MIITNNTDRNTVIAKILTIDLVKQPWKVDAEPYKPDRSVAQNKLSFRYYRLLGKSTGHGEQYERNYCKYTFGCPILLADDKDGLFTSFYDSLLSSFEYEKIIDAMAFIEVTRLFNKSQFQDYLLAIEQYAAKNHYPLITDDDMRNEAMVIK